MPRFEKGSKEAIEWGKKMKAARDKKKQMSGGWLQPGENVGALKASDAPQTEDIEDIEGGKISGMGPGYSKLKRKAKKIVPSTIQVAQANRFKLGSNGELPDMSVDERTIYENYLPMLKNYTTEDLNDFKREVDREKLYTGDWEKDPERVGIYIATLKALFEKGLEGGKISMGKISKGLSKVGKAFSTGTEKINPLSYAVKDKKLSNAMRKAGAFTQDYALPAVVQAGMPLYYGAAGTAGMMLGGPVGAVAATKGAELLYDEMVGKKGYDPRERQKSKLLGNVAKSMGSVGASELKSEMKQPKTKGSGMSRKRVMEKLRDKGGSNGDKITREYNNIIASLERTRDNYLNYSENKFHQYRVQLMRLVKDERDRDLAKELLLGIAWEFFNPLDELDLEDAEEGMEVDDEIAVLRNAWLEHRREIRGGKIGKKRKLTKKQLREIKMAREGKIRLLIVV